MPHSHHSHSGQFCRHAENSLEEVVVEALRQGFEVYGLSEHAPRWRLVDLFPEEVHDFPSSERPFELIDVPVQADLSPSDLLIAYKAFLNEATRLRETYACRIALLIGIEMEDISPLDLIETTRLIANYPEIDYAVGSVHHVNGVSIDFDRPTWLRAVRTVFLGEVGTTMTPGLSGRPVLVDSDPDDPHLRPEHAPSLAELRPFLLAYFDAQYEVLRAHQPEVIGHIDLCLLWTPNVSLRDHELKGVWEKVERNVKYAVGYGGFFEANGAALRKGWETSYPNRDVLEVSTRVVHALTNAECGSVAHRQT